MAEPYLSGRGGGGEGVVAEWEILISQGQGARFILAKLHPSEIGAE